MRGKPQRGFPLGSIVLELTHLLGDHFFINLAPLERSRVSGLRQTFAVPIIDVVQLELPCVLKSFNLSNGHIRCHLLVDLRVQIKHGRASILVYLVDLAVVKCEGFIFQILRRLLVFVGGGGQQVIESPGI